MYSNFSYVYTQAHSSKRFYVTKQYLQYTYAVYTVYTVHTYNYISTGRYRIFKHTGTLNDK